jgi:hypothetical protein
LIYDGQKVAMNKRSIVLLLSAAVASGAVGAFAQAPPAAGQTNGAASTSAVPSSSPDATTLTVRGTIDNYDQLTRTLVLSTHGGTVKFPVASTTRIRQGGQNVDPKELPQLSGKRATVRYTESGGNKIVESVHVFGK